MHRNVNIVDNLVFCLCNTLLAEFPQSGYSNMTVLRPLKEEGCREEWKQGCWEERMKRSREGGHINYLIKKLQWYLISP